MTEQELNKKLAEWVGFVESFAGKKMSPHGQYKAPEYCKWHYPYFTQSLDACFKWLVPKLKQSLELTITFHRCHGNIWSCILTWYNGEVYEEARHETPALALCKAIEKFIDGQS